MKHLYEAIDRALPAWAALPFPTLLLTLISIFCAVGALACAGAAALL